MSSQRSSAASQLKDRLLSNAPDPVQSSILRHSAKGWSKSSSPSSNSGTTPLRIAKREGNPPFPLVARRSSSSYKHVKNSNLVSKSPFKTQTSTPSRPSTSTSSDTSFVQQGTRRVSGEKRPRPDSMHEQAENERPLASKRERRQSKVYQGLIEKEPVTKSPFKRVVSSEEEQPPPVPPKASLAPPSPPPSSPPSRPITPSRPSLVSKRLHGPRAADQHSLDGRRRRRKTVTFDERCDVLEFDRDEEEEENPFLSSDEDDYGEPEQHNELESHHAQGHDDTMNGEDMEHASFESLQPSDANESITGIVNNIMQPTCLQGLGLPSTPSRHPSLPADMETEDGIPYGRTHHAERARRRASVSSPMISPPAFPFNNYEHITQDPPSASRTTESPMGTSSVSSIVVGMSTLVECAQQDHHLDEVEADVNMMSSSPSPTKESVRSEHSNCDSPIPQFEVQPPTDESSPKNGHSGVECNEQDIMNGDIFRAVKDDDLLCIEPSIAESPQLHSTPIRPQSSFGMLETSFDINESLGMGLRDSMGSIQLGEMRSALDRLMDDVKGSSGSSTKKPNTRSQGQVELVTEGTKVGQFSADTSNVADDSIQTETDMDLSMDNFHSAPIVQPSRASPLPVQRARTDSIIYTGPSFRSPADAVPPASPTKDAIKAREALILQKRRQAKRRDEQESEGYYTPPRPTSMPPSTGRSSRRRSHSTGDTGALTKNDLLLDIGISDTEEELLADSISKELRRLDPEHRQGKYRVREHEAIFASADAEQVSHTSFAGDVNSGKAWKAVRRPSDMNEYAKQIKEYRSQEKPGKAHGKVFVRVLGVRGLKVPMPQQATALTCTLNNGIHFVTTPETRLSADARIDQEFELIEHNKLEFTLTLKIRRDPHIVAEFKALAPPPTPAPQPMAPPPKLKGGMFGFLSSSPKKPVPRATPPLPPLAPPHKLPDNLARYLKQDGTLARAFVSFKDITTRCDTRLLEIKYPLIGQRSEASGGTTTMELGEIALQVFRLPSLPGVLSHQLPLSLDECLRGLRHVAWHKVTYFEGTLTQNGGDCMTWRRRTFRVTGANLIAFNDVTKKATATINLKKAIAVEDTHDARSAALSPDGRYRDGYDSLISVERSFRLVFPSEQEILFFADSDEEKARWLEVLRALVGRIPPNPLWAELVWQRQHEMAAHTQVSSRA